MATLEQFCRKNSACDAGVAWLDGKTPAVAYALCENPCWFLWVAEKLDALGEKVFDIGLEAADFVLRTYSAEAFEQAGFTTEAAYLRSLPQITTRREAENAAWQATLALRKAYQQRPVCNAKAMWWGTEAGWAGDRASVYVSKAYSVGGSDACNSIMVICRKHIPMDLFLEACRNAGIATNEGEF
jgi:hypothetical protein